MGLTLQYLCNIFIKLTCTGNVRFKCLSLHFLVKCYWQYALKVEDNFILHRSNMILVKFKCNVRFIYISQRCATYVLPFFKKRPSSMPNKTIKLGKKCVFFRPYKKLAETSGTSFYTEGFCLHLKK